MIATIENLTVTYGDFTAVSDLSLSIREGDIYGFIGPNGAGKTTTIRVMATLLTPAAGKVTIDGVDIISQPEKAKPLLGYMPDFFGVYDNLKVWEYLDFFARAYDVDPRAIPAKINDALTLTRLEHKRDSYVEDLSRGMKQRLCLAKTLIHDPVLLILDEPASGLDPNARREIRDLLKLLSRQNKTIFISSHILVELADVCNRVGIIELGKLVGEGSIDEMAKRLQPTRALRIRSRRPDKAQKAVEAMPGAEFLKSESGELLVGIEDSDDAAERVIKALVAADAGIVSVSEEKPDLEDIFKDLTKGMVI
ncbi:MAG: ABC transporter ATP-binding protein [Candidatus Abyssubacteria bacterium]